VTEHEDRYARLALVYRSILAILGAVVLMQHLDIFPEPFNVDFLHFFTNPNGIGAVAHLAGAVVYMLRNKVDALPAGYSHLAAYFMCYRTCR